MKQFKVRFSKNGVSGNIETVISADTDSKARKLAKLQYGEDITIWAVFQL